MGVFNIKEKLDEISTFEVILPDKITHFSEVHFFHDRSTEIQETESER